MARRHNYKSDPTQYPLAFESAAAERRARLMSALTIMGLLKLEPLAWFVFNAIEKANGKPLEMKVTDYAQMFGRSASTLRRWLWRLESVGIFEIETRQRVRGGQQTNRVSIHWPNVEFAAAQRGVTNLEEIGNLDRATKLEPRPTKLEPRPTNLEGPIRNIPLEYPSLVTTTSTTALPHARPASPGPASLATAERNEEEIFLEKLLKQCRVKFSARALPTRLEEAMRQSLGNGLTQQQLVDRCSWFHKHLHEWHAEHRAGVLYRGLMDAQPFMQAGEGWPYQR